jgi:hypothetical protein
LERGLQPIGDLIDVEDLAENSSRLMPGSRGGLLVLCSGLPRTSGNPSGIAAYLVFTKEVIRFIWLINRIDRRTDFNNSGYQMLTLMR